jgi:hypothetical protein
MQNLIENAIKSLGSEPPRVYLSTEEGSRRIDLLYQGYDIGLKIEQANKKLQMFLLLTLPKAN